MQDRESCCSASLELPCAARSLALFPGDHVNVRPSRATTVNRALMAAASPDPYDLHRFVEAQASNYLQALAEIRAGNKSSHWSWYVLPQLHGLGASPMSIRYAISGLTEARAYMQHAVLGVRLQETITALNAHTQLSAERILGHVDAQKLWSCLTLFSRVEGAGPLFRAGLERYFSAAEDLSTVAILARQEGKL